MKRAVIVLVAALLSIASTAFDVMAEPGCGSFNGLVPPGANTTDRSAPFFIDTTGLDLRTAVRRGCAAGALAAGRLGAQSALPTAAELDATVGRDG